MGNKWKKMNARKKKSVGCARRRERVAGERESYVFFLKTTQGHK